MGFCIWSDFRLCQIIAVLPLNNGAHRGRTDTGSTPRSTISTSQQQPEKVHNKYTHHHLVVCSVSVQQYYHNPLPYWYVWWSVCVLLNNRKTVFSMHLAKSTANKNTRVWFVVLPGNRANCRIQGFHKITAKYDPNFDPVRFSEFIHFSGRGQKQQTKIAFHTNEPPSRALLWGRLLGVCRAQ